MLPRLHACADDRENGRLVACQQTRGERGHRRGADRRHRGCVQQPAQLARLAIREDDLPLMAVEPTRGIVIEDEQQLRAKHRLGRGAIRRHPHRAAVDARRRPEGADWMMQTASLKVGERLLHDGDALAHREQAIDLFSGENGHRKVRLKPDPTEDPRRKQAWSVSRNQAASGREHRWSPPSGGPLFSSCWLLREA
jgi:hypothetical protein